ncbi:membrane protein insertion efficiency factor YidD [Cyclobacterium roseum]|uniref:membrane protein insertion efficiency factor YidD n=1 Tax=Cyclobacterium roseum TaxID=2666137 RepID=UPI00192F0AC1|nr:membrane protein insertion efficiency factor YidD [Cyclobacterium roseum]
MGKKTFIILAFQISLFNFFVTAQSLPEVKAHQKLMVEEEEKEEYEFARESKNEVEMVFSGLFLGYKKFISSQDGNTCVFTPSCSEYALMSIKKHGIILGTANAFDRLTRCNGLSPEKYRKDPESTLMIDKLE